MYSLSMRDAFTKPETNQLQARSLPVAALNTSGGCGPVLIESEVYVMNTEKVKNLIEKLTGSYACEDCIYYKQGRCKLWEVNIGEPADSHCESLRIK